MRAGTPRRQVVYAVRLVLIVLPRAGSVTHC
jgi:hypothetical protein